MSFLITPSLCEGSLHMLLNMFGLFSVMTVRHFIRSLLVNNVGLNKPPEHVISWSTNPSTISTTLTTSLQGLIKPPLSLISYEAKTFTTLSFSEETVALITVNTFNHFSLSVSSNIYENILFVFIIF